MVFATAINAGAAVTVAAVFTFWLLGWLAYSLFRAAGRRARFDKILGYTRGLDSEMDLNTIARKSLAAACEIVGAQVAELYLVSLVGPPRLFRLDHETFVVVDGWEATPDVVDGSAGEPQRHFLRPFARRCDRAQVSIRSAREFHGALIVREPNGRRWWFGDDDQAMLRSLATSVASQLDGLQLIARLRAEAAERVHQALHDPLTGLPNRRCVTRHLHEVMRRDSKAAVLLVDLDRFKQVNDALGYQVGDEVLRRVGAVLQQVAGPSALVARAGDDQFAVVARCDRKEAERLSRRVLSALLDSIRLRELEVSLGGGVGIAIAPDDTTDPTALLSHAEVAMAAAKAESSGIEFYSSTRRAADLRQMHLAVELRTAIEGGELELVYQPKYEPRSQTPRGLEALVRWSSERYGVVAPAEFIPIAEHSGLITPLTELVLNRALHDVRSFRSTESDVGVAVNVSTRSLNDGRLPERVIRVLDQSGFPPSLLTLEITESSVMRDPPRNIALLRDLSSLGVRISIDDFGTGYSSLSYLKRLPAQELKIDQSFIKGIAEDRADRAIVSAIIQLAHDLGIYVVAEGVETPAVLDVLTDIGCDSVQGYLLGRPSPIAALVSP